MDEQEKEKLRKLTIDALQEAEELASRPYLNEKELEHRNIAFTHCEDEACGFFVEFKYPNCSFYFCKIHKMGFNVDLTLVSEAGVACEQHGKMERYDLLREVNVCPSCESSTMAILSVGK
jgi:hypothetical protein